MISPFKLKSWGHKDKANYCTECYYNVSLENMVLVFI